MKWLTHSMQNRLMTIVTGGIAILIAVATSAIIAFNSQFSVTETLLEEQVAFERSIHEMNFDFKVQVQEWKNVLIRGHDDARRDKYWGKFLARHDKVQKDAKTLLSRMPPSAMRSDVESFKNTHSELLAKYQAGYNAYINSGYDHKVGDSAVAGIDRDPSQQLSEAARDITAQVTKASADVVKSNISTVLWSKIILWATALLIIAILWVTIKRKFLAPLSTMMEAISEFANGDFRTQIHISSQDELGQLAGNLSNMQAEIVSIITAVKQSSSELIDASASINQTATEISKHTGETEYSTDQVATAVNEMSSTVQEVSGNASGAAEAAQNADNSAQEGLNVMEQTMQAIKLLSDEVNNVAQAMDKLEQDTSSVGDVLGVIKGVAEQTNLLALNAAIEAARAGEQGRGFAVVADEVRALAQRTQESTEEIQQIIETVQSGASTAVNAMRIGQERTGSTVELAGKAGDSIRAITSSISQIRDMNTQIATAAEEQSYAAEEINKNVVNVVNLVQHAHQTAQHSTQVANSLDNTSRKMSELIAHFKV